jgi:hypothetical protein
MLRSKNNERRPVDKLEGIGIVYYEDDRVAEVAYDLTVLQDFVLVKKLQPPQEIQGPKQITGMLTTVGTGVIPLLRSALVLELQDQRKLDFYVSRPIPNGYEYQYEIKGSGWLRAAG